MKPPKGIESLADRLTEAATTPLVIASAPVETRQPAAAPPATAKTPAKRSAEAGSVSVFLRLKPSLFARFQGEATSRTKASGKGVSVQQVIIERLEQGV